VILCADLDRTETDLRAGVLACPARAGCAGSLRAWGHARARRVRQLDGSSVLVRPRRSRCTGCGTTQVLLPGTCVPRRADATEVIGAALLAKAHGAGHRRIAADLARPPSTVRRWLRAARSRPHLEHLRTRGLQTLVRVDPDPDVALAPMPTPLGQALTALAAAARAIHRWLPEITATAWTLVNVITAGRLLSAAPHR